MTTFFIGDTHFGHRAILEFEKEARPFATIEEHDEALIQNWNSVVTKRDVIYHMGDVIFSSSQGFKAILGRLNGIKKLIMGNHDSKRCHQLVPYFNSMWGAGKFEGYSLTHIPIHTSQFFRFKGNIHGHLHSHLILSDKWIHYIDRSEQLPDKRYINVSCEQIALAPISWDDLKVKHDL